MARQRDRRERRIARDVDVETAAIEEQRRDLGADVILERRLRARRRHAGDRAGRHRAGLRLAGQDRARGILRDSLEHLACEEHDRGLDDCEQQREEDRRDQRELDRRRTAAVAAKPLRHAEDRKLPDGRRWHRRKSQAAAIICQSHREKRLFKCSPGRRITARGVSGA